MDINKYQELALETVSYPDVGRNIIYPALKLAGEAGETADKIGKYWRNYNITNGRDYNPEQYNAIIKELGDVLWYISAIANEMNVDLETVAVINLEKLRDRRERGVIKSEGDNR